MSLFEAVVLAVLQGLTEFLPISSSGHLVLVPALLVGCAGLIAHTCLTNALSVAPAIVVTPMDFLRLPAIAVIGALFYAEPLNIWVLLGAALIFFGNYANLLNETRRTG